MFLFKLIRKIIEKNIPKVDASNLILEKFVIVDSFFFNIHIFSFTPHMEVLKAMLLKW